MLAKLFRSRVRAKVLGWLFTHPGERFFVRQLEALLTEDKTNISKELSRLAEMGIVTFKEEGRQKYFQADPSCPVFEELRGLALKTFGLADILKESLKPIRKKIDLAFVYGSMAGGRTTSDSDIDLMIIGKVSFSNAVSALHQAQDKLGREINPTVVTAASFRKKLTDGDHFLTTVTREPKIFLIGDKGELEALAKIGLGDKA